eukprot:7906826-Heterocapsa_arctica.AAC.1
MVRVVGNAITGGVNRGVLNMVAPTPEAIADDGLVAEASEAIAVPARRRVTGKSPDSKGFAMPLAEEGAQRVERAPDRRHGGQVKRSAGTDVQAEEAAPALDEAAP